MEASLIDGDLVELEQRDAIISIIKNDSYLADFCTFINQMDKTTFQNIETIPLTWKVLENNPEISVCLPSDIDYKRENNYINSKNRLYIHIAYQDAYINLAMDNCYKLAKSIRATLRQKLNLNRTCDTHLVTSIKPLDYSKTNNNLWTYIVEMTIETSNQNYVN
jgi:hypothetical protein